MLSYTQLLPNSAHTDEKITDALTFNYIQKDVVSCDVLNILTETSIINIESEDQNEKEEFKTAIFTQGADRLFLQNKQAFLIYHIASPMRGHLAPPPKTC